MADSLHKDLSDRKAPRRYGALMWWHGAWAFAVLVALVVLALAFGGLPPAVLGALACGLAPCLAAFAFDVDERPEAHGRLIVAWALFGGLAAVLTGGISGPLAPWCLAPVAAAVMIGRGSLMAQAAALSVLAAAVVSLAQLAGGAGAPPIGALRFWLGLLSLSTIAVGLSAALLVGRAKVNRRERRSSEADELAALLAAQPHLIALVEADGCILHAHGALPPGLDRDALRNEGLAAAAQSSDQAALEQAIATAREKGSASAGFTPAFALDRHLAVDLRRDPDGRLIAVVREDTQAHAEAERLEAAKTDAENLAAGKSRFLANMSHELRTPLNAIMGFSDIMRARMFGELPGKYVEYADLIYESGAHLLDLINDVLDMSKIEAQRYELVREVFDAREPISGALRIVRLQADEAGVQLRGVLPAHALEVDADRRALKQIVLNLVSNALKFTPRGGLVTVNAQAREGAFELVVADTGVGIAEEDLARLGRPYEQVGPNEKRSLGTGLGLSLVRAFAELHGGRMTIESRLGTGTAVTVQLPVLVAPTDSEPAPARPDNVVAFNPRG